MDASQSIHSTSTPARPIVTRPVGPHVGVIVPGAFDWTGTPAHITRDAAEVVRVLAEADVADWHVEAVRDEVRQLARDVLGQAEPEQVGAAILADPTAGPLVRQAVGRDGQGFRPGDRVRTTGLMAGDFSRVPVGSIGTVTRCSGSGNIAVRFPQDAPDDTGYYFAPDRLEHAPAPAPEPQFAVGDRVRTTGLMRGEIKTVPVGTVGTVTAWPGPGQDVRVQFPPDVDPGNDRYGWWYSPIDLEHVAESADAEGVA